LIQRGKRQGEKTMSTNPKPATSPSPVRPDEAQVRTEDLETPSPDPDGAPDGPDDADDADDSETRPGQGENAPGFLKPGKK
jgi:hypothetical protein